MAKNIQQKKQTNRNKQIEELGFEIYDKGEKWRTQKETANKIHTTLKGIIDEKNKKAHGYQMDFNDRLFKRLDKKWGKTLLKKHFGTESRKEAIKKMFDERNEKQYRAYKEEEKKWEKEEMENIFEIFKRAYGKNVGLHKGNDIDKKAIEFLLKKSGFFTDKQTEKRDIKGKIKEVPHGESLEKGVTFDSGKTAKGIKIENVEKTIKGKIHKTLIWSKAIFDEHPDDSKEAQRTNRPTSSTHMLHTILRSLNKIHPKEKQQIQRFVDFIDIIDGLWYQTSRIDYENNHRTLFGLHHSIPIEDIYKYFVDPTHTGFEILSDKELEKHTFKKTYKRKGKITTESMTWKNISNKEKENMEKDMKHHEQTKDRWLRFNDTRFIAVFDDEFMNAPKIMAHHHEGIFKIGIDKDTQEPYLYIFDPFQEFKKPIAGITPNGHFIHKKNIDRKTLENVLKEFSHTDDYLLTKAPKNQTKKMIIEYFDTIEKQHSKEKEKNELPTIDIKKLKIGQILEGFVRNVRNDKVFIKLGEQISGVIETEKKETTIQAGEKIKVKITKIEQTDNEKTHIYLKKIA